MVRGDLLEGWIRVSVGTEVQNAAFLEALDAALRG
jgi:histidinol-phosphate/aromatic aminotransferase/cobyric acid decarboxylase-like protein